MAYVTYSEYQALYGADTMPESAFNLIAFDAERAVDIHTTGIDNVRKLETAFPTDEKDAEIVKRCILNLIEDFRILNEMEKATQAGMEDGTFHLGAVASVSSGSESISYDNSANGRSALAQCVGDAGNRAKYVKDVIFRYLSGVTDKNGVNLLYMGRYPRV